MVTRTIPFFNYPALFKEYEEDYVRIFKDVCSRGAFILQRDLEEFEADLKSMLDVKFAFGVADGTNALILGLKAMGIGEGDEVIVPSHTYVASAASIYLVGATPILADCGEDHLIDPKSVRSLISKKTKAIMPVHLNGRTCNMDPIISIANEHQIKIVEDAAQALGSKFRGKCAGTFGSFGTFSFYPAKLLGCFGDGGAIITNDENIGEQLLMLRDHGRDKTGEVRKWGYNSRLDNLQAAILKFKLSFYDKEITRRRQIASMYHESLSQFNDLLLPPSPNSDNHFDCYQNYEIESGRRDELRAFLKERGIGTIIQWGGKALHQIEDLGFRNVNLPRTDKLFKRCLMLPMNVSLSDQDVKYICDTFKAFYA